ncbi:MAG: hypothetical protein LBJ67_15555, partial [Planctomycetaceae bacterium]|nr:hypothetical protein [Planctomycetaceae bacterium]
REPLTEDSEPFRKDSESLIKSREFSVKNSESLIKSREFSVKNSESLIKSREPLGSGNEPFPRGNERLPTVKDRIVQQAATIILEPIFETDFTDCSFGFRPERSAIESWMGDISMSDWKRGEETEQYVPSPTLR